MARQGGIEPPTVCLEDLCLPTGPLARFDLLGALYMSEPFGVLKRLFVYPSSKFVG